MPSLNVSGLARSSATPTPHAPATKLNELESLRGFAAIYVVVGHMINIQFHNPAWSLPLRFAGEAVMLFFLLSGFVIRYSTKDSTGTREYLFKRIRRIYPMFVLSLVLAYALASLAAGHAAPADPWTIVGNLAMLQDFGIKAPGIWVDQFYNFALWSLSYEFWFYILFIILIRQFANQSHRTAAVVALALVGFAVHMVWPNQLSYYATHLPIWWAGVRIAHEFRATGNVTLRRHAPWAAFLFALMLLWCIPLRNIPRSEWTFGLYPIILIRRFGFSAAFMLAAIIFAKHAWNLCGRQLFHCTLGPFKYLAPISYGIYVFHFPIVDTLAKLESFKNPVVYCVTTIALVLLVAYLCEILLQSWINTRTEPWLKRLKHQKDAVPVASPAPCSLERSQPSVPCAHAIESTLDPRP